MVVHTHFNQTNDCLFQTSCYIFIANAQFDTICAWYIFIFQFPCCNRRHINAWTWTFFDKYWFVKTCMWHTCCNGNSICNSFTFIKVPKNSLPYFPILLLTFFLRFLYGLCFLLWAGHLDNDSSGKLKISIIILLKLQRFLWHCFSKFFYRYIGTSHQDENSFGMLRCAFKVLADIWAPTPQHTILLPFEKRMNFLCCMKKMYCHVEYRQAFNFTSHVTVKMFERVA